MSRPSRDAFWFSIAEQYATRATCPRAAIGAVLVKFDRLIGAGFNGAPSGQAHCLEDGESLADHLALEHCQRSTHAERNAVANTFMQVDGATLYVVGPRRVCVHCEDYLRSRGVTDIRWRASASNNPMLRHVLDDYLAWANETFPGERTIEAAKHLVRETEELAADTDSGEEHADCVMLATFTLDRLIKSAESRGIDLVSEITRKLAINQGRTWGKPDADGIVEHIREVPA